MTELLRDLNDVQRGAVSATEGPVMVLAGAGSGKTRVITYRIAHLISQQGVDPRNILALTFTNKAAAEMRQRIDALLGPGSSGGLWIGTFHSVFARLLRSYIELLGYSNSYSIFDADDSKSLLRQAMQELGISQDVLPLNSVQGMISRAKNSFILPSEFHREAKDSNQQKAALVYERYVRKLRENNALDFDDLLIKPLELFREHPEVLAELQEQFRYILIDEYQDTNRVQYLVTKMLGERHQNVFVVGDDAQSIYSWRGADITNILNFQEDYRDTRTFKLVENYRSTGTILKAANSVISRNQRQIKKELVSHREEGEPVVLMEAWNERQEAEKIGDRIRSMHLREGMPYGGFAIFYRTNAQSRVLEDIMRQYRIPYRIFGSVSFYKRKEIKDAIAYLRFIQNDQDAESLLRIINFPPRKIGEVSIQKLKDFAGERGFSLYEAMRRASEGGFQQRLLAALGSFSAVIESVRGTAVEGTVYDVLGELYSRTGLPSLLQAENTPESLARLENLQELLSMARDFADHNPDGGSLGDFLENIALASDYDETQDADNQVALMTVHASKGLEFPVVFITGMEERLFPLNAYEPEQLEEERRLFYVAMTRAQERVFLSWAQSRYLYGQPQQCLQSKFIAEIDPSLIRGEGGASPSLRQPSQAGRPAAAQPYRPVSATSNAVRETPAGGAGKGIRKGSRVQHPVFGPGTVVELQGRGASQKARIMFRGAGEKTLMVQYANLKLVS